MRVYHNYIMDYWEVCDSTNIVTPNEMREYVSGYTYDKSTIDEKISSGGSSIVIDDVVSSASTNPVQNQAIYNRFAEDEEVTATALNHLNDTKLDISAKSDYYTKDEIDRMLQELKG